MTFTDVGARSKTLKPHERVRPFNFADDAAPHLSESTALANANTNAFFPLFRGGNNEVNHRPGACFTKKLGS